MGDRRHAQHSVRPPRSFHNDNVTCKTIISSLTRFTDRAILMIVKNYKNVEIAAIPPLGISMILVNVGALMQKNAPKLIQSIQRAIDILNCFSYDEYQLSLKTISNKVSLNINTARGIANTLVRNSLLIYDADKNLYRLGYYFTSKANYIQKQTEYYVLSAKPYIQDIVEKYHVTSSLQLVNNRQAYTVYSASAKNSRYKLITADYLPLPLHASSSGKLVLYHSQYAPAASFPEQITYTPYTPYTIATEEALRAEMEKIARLHYSTELEEYEIGVDSIAFPILNRSGKLVATISITTFENYFILVRDQLIQDLDRIASTLETILFDAHKL